MEVVDIPGSYLIVDMEDEVHVVFRGTLAEMLVMANPALYQPFVSYETGNPVLYVWLQKALYGCLKSALLLYKKLVGKPRGRWVQDKSIRLMCGQQDYRRETANSMLACGKSKNIMPRCEQSNKNDTVDQIRIWRNARVTWEET